MRQKQPQAPLQPPSMNPSEWQQLPVPLWMRAGSWGHSRLRSRSSSPLPQVPQPQVPQPQVPLTKLATPPQEQLRQQHLRGSWGRMEHRSRSCVQREAVPLPQE